MSGDYDFVNYDWEGIVFGPLKGKLRYAGGDVEELKALARFLRPWPRETAEEHERRLIIALTMIIYVACLCVMISSLVLDMIR
jgi:hypothetical protein